MLAAVSQRLSNAERRLNSLTSRDVESRVADYLLHLPGTGRRRHGDPAACQAGCRLPLDTTPESFSRALKSLARQALIVILAGRSVSITQPDQLQQLVDETLKPWPGVAANRRMTTASTFSIGTNGSSQTRESSETDGLSPATK